VLVAARLLWVGLVASRPPPGPPGTAGPGGIVSDEFSGGIVDGPVWHFVAPAPSTTQARS
jgi:hypothetical protein